MNGVAKFLAVLGALALIFVIAMISGTFLWLIWPIAVPATFPGLVASGVVAAKLSWWASVCLAWLFAILIKGTTSTSSKEK